MAKNMSRGKKRFIVAVVAVFTLAGAGAAFAYWTSTGSGAGSATTGTSTAFTISSSTAVGTIAPGGPGQTVAFHVTNPAGSGTQHLSAVTVTMATSATAPWVPTGNCQIADYTATITTDPSGADIAAAGVVDGVATVTLANTGLNQDDCQGQTVPLFFRAS